MKNIAFLGIGAMGERIASNLIDRGYQLHIWNRHPQKCQYLVEKGAIAYESPSETVQNVDLAIAMVTDDLASREVWLDKTTGAINGLKPNTVAMEFSTLTPAWCQELAREIKRQQCHFLDAPVVGSRPQAEASQLTYLVGGEAKILERVKAILEVNSAAIHHVGDVGDGMKFKLAVNTLFATQVAALSEALGVLNQTGISVESAVDLLNRLPTTSPALKGIGILIENENYAPLFPIDLVAKDLKYMEQLGNSVNAPTSSIAAIQNIYQQAQKIGYGSDNIAGIARLFL